MGNTLENSSTIRTEPEYYIYTYFVYNINLAYWNELSDHTVTTSLIEAIEIIKLQKIHLKCSAIPFCFRCWQLLHFVKFVI